MRSENSWQREDSCRLAGELLIPVHSYERPSYVNIKKKEASENTTVGENETCKEAVEVPQEEFAYLVLSKGFTATPLLRRSLDEMQPMSKVAVASSFCISYYVKRTQTMKHTVDRLMSQAWALAVSCLLELFVKLGEMVRNSSGSPTRTAKTCETHRL